jgi:TldD protein
MAIAEQYLLNPWGLGQSDFDLALGDIFKHKVDYADLYFQYTRSQGWALEEGIVKTGSFSISQGVGIRAIAGEKTAFAYSDALSREAIMNASHAVRAIGAAGQSRSVKCASASSSGGIKLYDALDPIASLPNEQKVQLLEKIEGMARRRDPHVVQVMAGLGMEYDVVLVVGSDGRQRADVRPLVRLSLTVIAQRNGRRETGHAGGGGRTGLGYFTEAVLQGYVDRAVHEAMVNLEARAAPAGEMTVVLGSGWPGILLHEAVGHGLEGDFNRKGSSAFAGRVGERVASPGVTVVDDGTLSARRGSLNMDDEGNPTQRTVLIEDGILRGYLQDSLNARLTGVESTGNGRRESFAHLPMPRMTNTYMLAGRDDPQDIVRSVKRGLYAVNFGGGQVDITSGKFVFSASEAYMIEDGEIAYPVKGATLIGNGPDALTRVSMIGHDMQLDSGVGTCGKEGQSVPVGVGMPTIRLDGLTVGGTA